MVKQFTSVISIDEIICLAGLILLACWLVKTSLGRYALADSVPRRNNMSFYVPLIPLFIWLGSVSLAISVSRELLGEHHSWQNAFFDNIIFGIGAIMTTVVIIFLARTSFARGLKGFGLNAKTIPKDFLAAILNLLSVWPLVVLMVILTLFFGRLVWGQDFQMQRHQQLETITAYPQLLLRVLIVVVAVVIAPIFEEMLFRGLFQTMIRSYLVQTMEDRRQRTEVRPSVFCLLPPEFRPWISILVSSVLFATVHQQDHWPALFVLAVCLGYAYEKSGSLLRPIFIHALFNAVMVTAALNRCG